MNRLNTSRIGDNFELKSLGIITKAINDGQLGLLPNVVRVYQKKEYYSAKRRGEIEFDLALEVWPLGALNATLFYLIECKHYAGRVPVGRLEEFHSKISQVSDKNVKAIFITNSPLQKSAFDYAENSGMMVIQGESMEDYKILLHKSKNVDPIRRLPFIKSSKNILLVDQGTELLEGLIDNEIRGIFKSLNDPEKVSYNIDSLTKEEIEELALKELEKINPKILSDAYTIDIKKLKIYLNDSYQIDFRYTNRRPDLLGTCSIVDNFIEINEELEGTRRELFVIAHEFGHYLLHQKLSIGQNDYDFFEDSKYNFKTAKHDLINPKQWIEWQANHFAISLILPKALLLTHLWKVQSFFKIRRGTVFIDDQHVNIITFVKLIDKLSYIFNVSKTSIIYRLKEIDKLDDRSNLKSIGQIVSEYQHELFL